MNAEAQAIDTLQSTLAPLDIPARARVIQFVAHWAAEEENKAAVARAKEAKEAHDAAFAELKKEKEAPAAPAATP